MMFKDTGRIAFTADGESTELYIPEVEGVAFVFEGDATNTPVYRVEGGLYDVDTDTIAWATLNTTSALSENSYIQLDMRPFSHGRVTLVSGGSGAIYYGRYWRQ